MRTGITKDFRGGTSPPLELALKGEAGFASQPSVGCLRWIDKSCACISPKKAWLGRFLPNLVRVCGFVKARACAIWRLQIES